MRNLYELIVLLFNFLRGITYILKETANRPPKETANKPPKLNAWVIVDVVLMFSLIGIQAAYIFSTGGMGPMS